MLPQNTKFNKPESHKILIGDITSIRLTMVRSITLIYSGMPNENTFAITAVISQAFFMEGFKFSSIFYFPKHSKVIKVLDCLFDVEEVTTHMVVLRYRKVNS